MRHSKLDTEGLIYITDGVCMLTNIPSAAAPAGMAFSHGVLPAAEAADGARHPGQHAVPGWWHMGPVPPTPMPGQTMAQQASGFASAGQRPAASTGGGTSAS